MGTLGGGAAGDLGVFENMASAAATMENWARSTWRHVHSRLQVSMIRDAQVHFTTNEYRVQRGEIICKARFLSPCSLPLKQPQRCPELVP